MKEKTEVQQLQGTACSFIKQGLWEVFQLISAQIGPDDVCRLPPVFTALAQIGRAHV